MTNLSPEAQAILDAYQFAPIEDELTAAAVLRAAAEQIAVPDGQPEVTLWEIGFCAGIRSAQSGLITIAAELEAQ